MAANEAAWSGVEHELVLEAGPLVSAGRTVKRKICIYVSEELVTRLSAVAEHRGATKSGLVGAALDRFLNAAEERDDHPGVDERLARMGHQLDHLAHELKLVGETIAMHARYHLTVTTPLPDAAQPAACRLGAARSSAVAFRSSAMTEITKPDSTKKTATAS